MSWCYQVGTKEYVVDNHTYREFGIIEVYYNRKGKAGNHSNLETFNPLTGWDNYKDLKGTYKMIKEAFKQPILDLDNWPNEYKEKK